MHRLTIWPTLNVRNEQLLSTEPIQNSKILNFQIQPTNHFLSSRFTLTVAHSTFKNYTRLYHFRTPPHSKITCKNVYLKI